MKIRIKTILLCSFIALSFSNCCGGHQADNNNGNEAIVVDQANPWKAMGEVEKSIEQTNFPTKTFNIVTDYQAIAGEDVSDIIRRAISDCHRAGGGRVVIPAGEYYTKAIHLLSNVNLHLEKGATLKFSTIPSQSRTRLK